MVINYHNITYPDMLNGDGLRVVLWLSGCSHNCYKCQNPQTHNPNSGIWFDEKAEEELFRELSKDYISGLTLTGGDPLHENNLDGILNLVNKIRLLSPSKTIWLYTGYRFDEIFGYNSLNGLSIKTINDDGTITFNNNEVSDLLFKRQEIILNCDVLVDGRYIDAERDITLKWRGSKNQRCINIKESLEQKKVVLWCD